MAEPHVVPALIRKRAEIAGKIEHAQTTIRQIIIDLNNLDAKLRLFWPDFDLEEIRPKPLPPRNQAYRGEVTRLVRILGKCVGAALRNLRGLGSVRLEKGSGKRLVWGTAVRSA